MLWRRASLCKSGLPTDQHSLEAKQDSPLPVAQHGDPFNIFETVFGGGGGQRVRFQFGGGGGGMGGGFPGGFGGGGFPGGEGPLSGTVCRTGPAAKLAMVLGCWGVRHLLRAVCMHVVEMNGGDVRA
jgi:hypothetical protein